MGNKRWNSLDAPDSVLFPWDVKSTYIRCPSFFDKLVSTGVLFDLLKINFLKKGLGEREFVQCFQFFLFRPKNQLHPSLLKMPMSCCTWETLSLQTTYHLLEALLGAVLLLSTWQTEGMYVCMHACVMHVCVHVSGVSLYLLPLLLRGFSYGPIPISSKYMLS